jgi:ribosome-associated protein
MKKHQTDLSGIHVEGRLKQLLDVTVEALEDLKAVDIRVLDVRGQTSITDLMVVAGGTSTRHIKSLADSVAERAREAGMRAPGVEGDKGSEWILIDLIDIVVHIMLPETRAFYALEKLWSVGAGHPAAESDHG